MCPFEVKGLCVRLLCAVDRQQLLCGGGQHVSGHTAILGNLHTHTDKTGYLSDDGQHFNVDSIELIEAAPGACGIKSDLGGCEWEL